MSTVAYRSSATATTTTTTDGSSVTITKPAGTASGDTLVAVLTGYLASNTLTVPTGWLLTSFSNDGVGLYVWVYQKMAGGSEAANYTFTWTSSVGALTGSIAAFSGGNGIDQCVATVTTTTNPSVGSDVYPNRPAMRYDVMCWRDTVSDTVAWSIGTAEVFDIFTAGAGSVIFRGQSGVYSSSVNAAGVSINANTATISTAPTFGVHLSMSIADAATTAPGWASTGFGVELNINSAWTDVTDPYVRAEAGITITRGKDSAGGEVNPSTAQFTLENIDGRFSPKNPNGAYYGYIGRNTPVRIWKAQGTVGMQSTGQDWDRFECPNSTALQIAGDFDIRVDAQPETWRQEQVLAAQGGSTGSYQSAGGWTFYLDDLGFLHLSTANGFEKQDVQSTLPVPAAIRQTVRATLDVDNGAAGCDIKFYTSDSVGGSFTQLGSTVTSAFTTSIGTTSRNGLSVGSNHKYERPYYTKSKAAPLRGRIYAVRLYSDLTSTTLVAAPDFTVQSNGTYTFQDAQFNVWTAYGSAVATNRSYRFHGEVTSWPQRWDSTGRDVTTPVECAGALRRIQQGDTPIRSAMYRYYTNTAGIYTPPTPSFEDDGPYFAACYWPLEDANAASTLVSSSTTVPSAKVVGSPTFGAYEGFASSEPILQMKTGATVKFPCVSMTSGGFAVEFLLSAPSGITNGAVIFNITTSGADKTFELSYPTTDRLLLRTLDADGVQIATSGNLTTAIVGKLNRVIVSSTGTTAYVLVEELSTGVPSSIGTCAANATIGTVASLTLSPGALLNDVYIGHVAVFDGRQVNSYPYHPENFNGSLAPPAVTPSPVNSYRGEDAASRARRLIAEGGFTNYNIGSGRGIHAVTNILGRAVGDPTGTLLGYQTQSSLIDNLREIENTDAGYLYEPRGVFGLGYRTRQSMYNLAAAATFSYSGGELSGDLQPEEDDFGLCNDATVTRTNGASFRYIDATSALSTLAPPLGVGTYDSEFNLSLNTDDQVAPHAGWRVKLGTVNELRYPSVQLALENARIAASSTLTASLLLVDIGDRVVITGQPSWLPPDQITQQVIGYSEYIDKYLHDITLYTVPESPYQVAQATTAATSVTQSKVMATGSTLNATLTTTATSVTVAIASGSPLWTTSGVDFDIIIAGERMTCTAVSGASSPQTFTLTRSVNGIVKTHAVGETVTVFRPAIVAL